MNFVDILKLRGRVLVFTPRADLAVRCEQAAQRIHMQVVSTRGQPDKYIPLSNWNMIHNNREAGLFSTDQHSYLTGVRLPCTDVVWVGHVGDPMGEPMLWARSRQAFARAGWTDSEVVRIWTLEESQVP